MSIEKIRTIIKEREETDSDWDYAVEKCWKKEIEILCEDIPGTIEFLENECTADEYAWISEIIIDIADITMSKELVESYKKLSVKFPKETAEYYIEDVIKDAEIVVNYKGYKEEGE